MIDKDISNNQGEIVIYQSENGDTKIDVRFVDETVWLTQQQMADLFNSSRSNIVEHIKHIYEEGELDEISTCRNFRQVRIEGNRQVSRDINHSCPQKHTCRRTSTCYKNKNIFSFYFCYFSPKTLTLFISDNKKRTHAWFTWVPSPKAKKLSNLSIYCRSPQPLQ